MEKYIGLLKALIAVPSLSGHEEEAAAQLRAFLDKEGIPYTTSGHNTWMTNRDYVEGKPVVWLNSHIDTVRPASGWKSDPFDPAEEGDRITGLGSNDAGASVVALLAAFIHFYPARNLPFNLLYAATAEEENSGEGGLRSLLGILPPAALVVVGEPTRMAMAVAEKGLLVLDCTARGKAGHAAREEGINALYKALDDITRLRDFHFPLVSQLLGPVKITVTQIEAGTQHNVIPDTCRFTADVRTNEYYSNEEACRIIAGQLTSEVKARSFRLNSSGIPLGHPVVQRATELGISLFGSPTTSDQAVIPYPSVKIGPGDSARSHTAEEYILKSEIADGVSKYISLLEGLQLQG
jgi:acetylornithine deacetylase